MCSGQGLCLFFHAAAGAHYPGTMPHANHSSLLPSVGEGWWAREGSSSPDWREVEGWSGAGREVEKGLEKGLDRPHTVLT